MQYITKRQLTLTTDGAAHVSGDAVGGELIFTKLPKYGYIVGVIYHDLAGGDFDYDLFLFASGTMNADGSPADPFTPTADNSAFDIADAELPNLVARVPITALAAAADNGIVETVNPCRIPYEALGGQLHGQLVTRGGNTPDATGNRITLYIEHEGQL